MAPNKDPLPIVLVIDSSITIRKKFETRLGAAGFEVISVSTTDEANLILEKVRVDIITLDSSILGNKHGNWLRLQRKSGLTLPVVIIGRALLDESHQVAFSLKSGAQDFFDRDDIWKNTQTITDSFNYLIGKRRKGKKFTAGERPTGLLKRLSHPDVILIGASTGGPEILNQLLKNMPPSCPPIVIVQHIEPEQRESFYYQLAKTASLKTAKPKSGLILKPGHLYMAMGHYYIGIGKSRENLVLKIETHSTYQNFCPSVDHLFHSATSVNANICAVLLTGLGSDGARGLAELHRKGALTFAQDKESSPVFGMPQEAIRLGAASIIGNPKKIRSEIEIRLMSMQKSRLTMGLKT